MVKWLDYGARWYDPAVARWWSSDPLAESFPGYSSYNYALNNPVLLLDPDGRAPNPRWYYNVDEDETEYYPPDETPTGDDEYVYLGDSELDLLYWEDQRHGANLRYPSFRIEDADPGQFFRDLGYFQPEYQDILYPIIDQFLADLVEAGLATAGKPEYRKMKELAKQRYPGKADKMELHHITPIYLGGPVDGDLVPLNAAYHQVIPNAFRDAWEYGRDDRPSQQELRAIMDAVYSKYPLPPGYDY